MKNLTRLAILLAAVIGFTSAKPVEATPHYGYKNYHVTRYYVPKPTYYHVPRYRYYYPKYHSHRYYPKKHSTYRVYYYR
jgi:hypothetical protein